MCIAFRFRSEGVYVAFSSITTFSSGKKVICGVVPEPGISVPSSRTRQGREATPFVLLPGPSGPAHRTPGPFSNLAIPEKGALPGSEHRGGVGGDQHKHAIEPMNQVALSFITTQFSFSGRNDRLTAEQVAALTPVPSGPR